MSERLITIWADAVEDAAYCVPHDIREQVLIAALERERKRKTRPPIMKANQFVADLDLRYYHEAKEAVSVMIQTLTRGITNNTSKEDAAEILFREHRRGTGSGWLPHYLDGLPGIEVDKDACAAIADLAGPSELREVVA